MKRLLFIALALVVAGGAIAQEQDTFGLWQQVDGEYRNFIPAEETLTPFTLFVTLHDSSIFTIGGYEVGLTIPSYLLILDASGPNDWTNFGDNTNHLVGYITPLPTFGEPIVVLGQIECLVPSLDGVTPQYIVYGGANPPSIPDHDGPVIADGVNPDVLIPCGYVNEVPEVFLVAGVVGTEAHTLTDVKALFD
jgi:hypothetical protein